MGANRSVHRVPAPSTKPVSQMDQISRYATEADSRRGESPLDHEDHAMDALRYLIASIDERKLGRRRKIDGGTAGEKPKERKWLSLYDEALWTRIWQGRFCSLLFFGSISRYRNVAFRGAKGDKLMHYLFFLSLVE